MGTEVCSKCSALFFSTGSKICPACLEMQHKVEDCIFDYLERERGIVTIEQLHRETKVPLGVILEMFNRGAFLHHYKVASSCEICGTHIYQGKICTDCASKMSDGIREKSKTVNSEANRKVSRFYSR